MSRYLCGYSLLGCVSQFPRQHGTPETAAAPLPEHKGYRLIVYKCLWTAGQDAFVLDEAETVSVVILLQTSH